MLLVLLLSAAVALPSSKSENKDGIYRDSRHGNKSLGDEIANYVKLYVDNVNVKLIVENANANAKRAEEIANANVKLVKERLEENTVVLKQILEALGKKSPPRARDCSELFEEGEWMTGSHVITIPSTRQSFEVFCDMKTDGGGWTVFQRRGQFVNPQDYFNRTWTEYKDGFGEPKKEFWLGNDRISALTQQKQYVLRVDLWDMDGNNVYAKYNVFKVDNEQEKYRLSIDGYSGNAGDSMITSSSDWNLQGMSFSTKDRDNDLWTGLNCSTYYRGGGGWWFNHCSRSNLNGINLKGGINMKGIMWYDWKNSYYSMAFAEMKIRPIDF